MYETVSYASKQYMKGRMKEDELRLFLKYVNELTSSWDHERIIRGGRLNWNLVVLEQCLLCCHDVQPLPQCIIDKCVNQNGKNGDLLGVVRTMLRYNRPIEAGRIMINVIEKHDKNLNSQMYISYTAFDAFLESLVDAKEQHEAAGDMYRALKEK